MHVLIIDNYDSFVYNLYQYIGEILSESHNSRFSVTVKRNDELNLADVRALSPDRIIISPGPGSADDDAYFGICSEVIHELGKSVPLLGVCLGMQGIAHVFGGRIIQDQQLMHGKTSLIMHDGQGVYRHLPQSLEVMRYHSLIVEPSSLPSCFTVSSVSVLSPFDNLQENLLLGGKIMGIRHKHLPIEGVQFHPESFATEGAKTLLRNFLIQ